MRQNLKLGVIALATTLVALSPIFIFRSCRSYLTRKPKRSYVHEQEPVDLPEELRKGPPKREHRLYSANDYREHFGGHRAALDEIVTMAREEKSRIRIGWHIWMTGMPEERMNAYLALLRELGSTEGIRVSQNPFRVEVTMYCQGLSVSGMIRGYLYSPDEKPYPPVFVDDLEVGMRRHPDGLKMIYVPLGDGWYVFCDWR